ncbi:MAG TPA: xanthine dehydrogenase family protein [Chloroflexota bacterium]|nr:xanthine dehydrogenase family protein [Chloroflexota bacterium]
MCALAPGLVHPEAPSEHGRGPRVDGELKVSGQMLYSDDLALEGLLHVAVVRSPHPHARIVRVDTAAAKQVPGVRLVLTGADVAAIRFGRAVRDVPILAVDKVRFAGEMVAAVAADDRDAAEEAAALIEVEYEELPAVFDPVAALADDAPAVHDAPWAYAGAARKEDAPRNLMGRATGGQGDVEAALAAADRVFEHTFRTQAHHQGYIEPHSATVYVGPDGHVQIWSCNKSPYRLREQLAAAFDIPIEQITAHSPAIGGDFGGKGSPMDMPLCYELSRRTGRPVRMTRRYAEELMAAGPRHASVSRVRVGVSHDGRLQAFDMHTWFNGGAYAGFRPNVNFSALAATSYRIPAIRVIADRVYTNQVPGGNARTPGAPQMCFAVEAMLDLVARELGIEPLTFRRNNLLRPGDANPFGEQYVEVRALETLDAAEAAYQPVFPRDAPPTVRFGRGVAVYDRPTHPAAPTSIRLLLLPDGTVEAQIPQMETGTGSHTIIRRVAAEGIGLPRDRVTIRYVGTANLPFDSGVGGSRVTVAASEAAHQAALQFRALLAARAAQALGVSEAQVEPRGDALADRQSGRTVTLQALAQAASQAGGPLEAVVDTRQGSHDDHHGHPTSYCVQIAQVGVDVETGQVSLYEVLTVIDVAEILDPLTHQCQIDGGVGMGIGYALTEDLAIEDGRVTAAHMGEYKLPAMPDVGSARTVLVTGGKGIGARNVKAIGEIPNVPTAAAIANAVADAVGVRVDSLPVTAEKVQRALAARRAGS